MRSGLSYEVEAVGARAPRFDPNGLFEEQHHLVLPRHQQRLQRAFHRKRTKVDHQQRRQRSFQRRFVEAGSSGAVGVGQGCQSGEWVGSALPPAFLFSVQLA